MLNPLPPDRLQRPGRERRKEEHLHQHERNNATINVGGRHGGATTRNSLRGNPRMEGLRR